MKKIIIALLILFISVPVTAEIEKNAIPGDNGFQFYWWPVLPKVEGWHQDEYSSYRYSANTQAPDGETFSNAESGSVCRQTSTWKPTEVSPSRFGQTEHLHHRGTEDTEENCRLSI